MKDERFPKAPLIKISFEPPCKLVDGWRIKPMYWRIANAAELWIPFLFIRILWRMPWSPIAAWSMGWDACWRQENRIPDKGYPSPKPDGPSNTGHTL